MSMSHEDFGSIVLSIRDTDLPIGAARRWVAWLTSHCPVGGNVVWGVATITVYHDRKTTVAYQSPWDVEGAFDAAFATNAIAGWCESPGRRLSRSRGEVVAFSRSTVDLMRFAGLAMECMRTVAGTIHIQPTEPE